MSSVIQIATRKSKLALWQAKTTRNLLLDLGIKADLLPLVTTGDKMQKSQLADVNLDSAAEHHLTTGKGLFIKEIQEALLSGRAQVAVHSMKDLPVTQTKGLSIVSLLPRAGVRDVLILSPKVLEETQLHKLTEDEKKQIGFLGLKEKLLSSKVFCSGVIGTTSSRRQMLLRKAINENLNLQILRGNVDSRLQRLRNNEFSAIVLAEAGLERLELFNSKEMFLLPFDVFIPATAQGVIAVEIPTKQTQLYKQMSQLNCHKTCKQAGIERLVLFLLGGDCHSSIGVYFTGKEIFVICARNGIEKQTKISIKNDEFQTVSTLFEKSNFVYSDFFEQLCVSPFARKITTSLFENGFSEVSEIKMELR